MRIRGHWRDGGATLDIGPAAEAAGAGAAGAGAVGAGAAAGAAVGAAVVVPVEVAASYAARTRGLLGRDGIEGAMLLTPAASVHTFRMRFAIDVAYLDRRLRVVALTTMPPGRLGLPRLRARHVLEAEAGAMAAWGLRVGSVLRLRLDRR